MEQHPHGANLFVGAFHYMFGRTRTPVNEPGDPAFESAEVRQLQSSQPIQPVRLPPLKRR